MVTTKDSNKLTIIYTGKPEEYAFIPLDVSENTYYNFTNGIIYNDGSTYIKNITAGSSLYNFIKAKIMDTSAPAIRDPDTISITNGTYNINGYLSNNMLTHNIKLYYIENFKYTLDASQYTKGDDENTNVVNRGTTYMFTIIPKLTRDVSVLEASQKPVEPGGGSGSGGGDTSSGETEDPNKKYDIVFSVDGNQTLSLTRIGTTNNYKLGGTLVIKYEQSDKSIKNDIGTISTITNNNSIYTFVIYLGSVSQPCVIQRIDGYNTTSKLWEGKININLDEMIPQITYTLLSPGSTISCELRMNISKDVPIFSKHGSRLNSYIVENGNSYGKDNFGLYKFKLNTISVPKAGTAKAYFLQSLIGQYGTWDQTALNVMKVNNMFGSRTSGIFIIVSDGKYLNYVNISSRITSSVPNYLVGDFKLASTGHNSIFTSPLNNNNTTVVLDGPPIFLYDESNKQTKIDKTNGYETDNNIFDETYFKHKSGNKFPVPASTERKKNIINLNNYKYLMYEKSSSKPNHYCGKQLTNADLSAYEGKTFNVVYEVWTYKINSDFQPSINTPIKNKDGEHILTSVSPSYNLNQKIDRIDWETGGGGGTTIKPVNTTYTATVTQYKLYSFKLSKTDSTTGVYEYTFTD